MTVTMHEILRAAELRTASLVAELCGYLVLGAADRIVGAPRLANSDNVVLESEGAVNVVGGVASEDDQAERSLRELLASSLRFSRVGAPAIHRAASSTTQVGLRGLIAELEAALIPVNRAAGRRALARLHREVTRAKAAGLLVPPGGPESGSEGRGGPSDGGSCASVPSATHRSHGSDSRVSVRHSAVGHPPLPPPPIPSQPAPTRCESGCIDGGLDPGATGESEDDALTQPLRRNRTELHDESDELTCPGAMEVGPYTEPLAVPLTRTPERPTAQGGGDRADCPPSKSLIARPPNATGAQWHSIEPHAGGVRVLEHRVPTERISVGHRSAAAPPDTGRTLHQPFRDVPEKAADSASSELGTIGLTALTADCGHVSEPPRAERRSEDSDLDGAVPVSESHLGEGHPPDAPPPEEGGEAEPTAGACGADLGPLPAAPRVFAPRRSDISQLVDDFGTTGVRSDRELCRDLQELAGVDATPGNLPLVTRRR